MCDVKVKRAKSMYKMLGIFIFEPQYIVRTVVSYACECCVSLYPGLISLVYPAQWAKTQKKLYTECTWLFLLCIDVPKKSINHFIHRFCPFYFYVAHMYLQGKNRKNSCENYRSPHILAHSTTTYHPGFSAGLLWWYWGRAWGPNDAAIMTFSYLPRTQDAIPMAEWLQATNTGDIFLWCGQHKGPQCPKARPLVSTRYFSRNYGAQGPPIVVWWLRSFWWSAVIRILHWSQNWKWRGGEKKKRDWLIRFVLWMVV